VIEEFLPILVRQIYPEVFNHYQIGPKQCFSGLFFSKDEDKTVSRIRKKDQDFAISKRLYLKSSIDHPVSESTDTFETDLAFLCAECKTNFDKTMLQESCSTAHDLKSIMQGSRYYVLCEWLDMTPVSIENTDIDEVLLLRKAKRIDSKIRSLFSTKNGRSEKRNEYCEHLKDHPFEVDVFERFLSHVLVLMNNNEPEEKDVLSMGYF
jgi:hypothetical protein